MNDADARLGKRIAVSVTVFGGFVVAAFAAFALGWRGTADTANVAVQIPFLISGGGGGLILLASGLGLLVMQLRRIDEARRTRRIAEIVAVATDLVRVAREEQGARR